MKLAMPWMRTRPLLKMSGQIWWKVRVLYCWHWGVFWFIQLSYTVNPLTGDTCEPSDRWHLWTLWQVTPVNPLTGDTSASHQRCPHIGGFSSSKGICMLNGKQGNVLWRYVSPDQRGLTVLSEMIIMVSCKNKISKSMPYNLFSLMQRPEEWIHWEILFDLA